MDDAALVDAARRGDDGAWGAIYDRYADKLHDHCFRIVRDRGDAEDALHDAFIAASRNLHQLRDPSRLRPWLYSICRHEALRYARKRSRVELSDEVGEMSGVEVDLDQGSSADEVKELVWAAAAGLNPRDQALLDLNLRQGLEGQDLADAMGTSLANSYVMLSRLRDQVERSLGALLIARLGRDDCDDLAAILQGWDGAFSPLLRKRVARHVDSCEVCERTRGVVASPLALLAAAPLVPAPSQLRRRVLDGIGSGAPAAAPIAFTAAGFAEPDPAWVPAPKRRGAWLLAAGAAVLVAALLVGILAGADDDPTPIASEGTATSTTLGVATTAPTTSTTVPTTSTTVPTTSTTQPEAPPATDDPMVVPPPPTPPADTTPPSIIGLSSSEPAIQLPGSGCTTTSTTITATISGATQAILRWTEATPAGSRSMSRSGDQWRAVLGPFATVPDDLVLDYVVEARDAAGNVATRAGSISLTPCPG